MPAYTAAPIEDTPPAASAPYTINGPLTGGAAPQQTTVAYPIAT